MTGYGLKSVTFFNTGQLPYGHIDLDGNTLLTGTNGAGKTTTHQSILFFYGNSRRERLGISKSDGKLSWAKYMYPNPNSYVFYRYTGLHGDVILMTYPYSVGTAWRFIGIDKERINIDLAAIVLENNVPKIPQEVVNAFIVAGFKPTTQINDRQIYRRILYGDIDNRNEKELAQFQQYALMKAPKNFQYIPEMQSSIFVNSKIGTGAIEKAITSGYGMQSSLSLPQIKKQLQEVKEQFEAVQVYTKWSGDIQKMESTAKHYRDGTEKVESILRQIMGNKLWWEKDIETIVSALESAKKEQAEKLEAFEMEIIASDDAYRKIVDDEIDVRVKLELANEKKERYVTFDMDTIVSEVEQISTIEKEKIQKKSEYENSLGGAKTITETYDEMLKTEEYGLLNQILLNNGIYNSQKEALDGQKDSINNQHDKEIDKLEGSFETDIAELKSCLTQAEYAKHDAFMTKTVIDSLNPHLDEVTRLKNDISKTRKGIESASKESEFYALQINTLASRREEIERNIESISENGLNRFNIERKPLDYEIQTLAAKLEAPSESVLGLIRNELPEMEEVLASLLKDEILLSTKMSPSVVEIHPSAYGLMFDTEALPKSEITKEAIVAKMAEVGKAVTALQKRIAEETDSRIAVKNKEKGEVKKEIYSLKTKKDDADAFISKNSSKLFSFEEDFLVAESNAIVEWEKDKETASKQYDEASERHKTLGQQLNEASQKLKGDIALLKSSLVKEIGDVSDKMKISRGELEEKNNAAKKNSIKSVEGIENRRKEALTNDGYSPDKINELKQKSKLANDRYNNAVNNTSLVVNWRTDKLDIDMIPYIQVKHEALLKSMDETSARNKELITGIDAKKKDMDTNILEMEKNIVIHNIQIDDATSVIKLYEFKTFVQKIEDEEGDAAAFPPYNAESASTLKNNVIMANNKMGELGRIATSSLQKFLSHIPDIERFVFFEYDISSPERAVRSIEHLAEFVESGGLDEIKETIASEIRLIQGNLSDKYESFKSETKSIEELVQRIDRGLKKAIEKIPVINELSIRIIRNEHRIFRDLEAIASVDIPYGDTNSLFADQVKSSKSSAAILEYFTNLLSHLGDERVEELTIADTIEVQFKITENRKTSDWSASKGNIGSAGTSIIVKTLTYVALLHAVIETTQKGESVPVHVMLDEIGTIDQHNMRQIIDFANENGILFLNAAPDIKIPDRYKNMYGYKLSGGKTKVLRLIVQS